MIFGFLTFFALLGLSSATLDPEIKMSVPEIIQRWGYPAEEMDAITEDNYILTMHRIPYGKDGPSANRPVIFLQHGLEDSSFSWVSNLPSQSAAFIFADAGFDVWMGNMRGNRYSRDHVKLNPKSQTFWRFTFDEMVKYDLDAMINQALKITNQSSLYYVGHSQGTLTMFSKLSQDQEFHKKIRKFFALAPVGRVKNIRGLLDIVAHVLYDEVNALHAIFGDGEFLPSSELMTLISEYVCETTGGGKFCDSVFMLFMGVDSNQLNVTRSPVYFSHIPSGTSTLNVLHWAQMARSGLVSAYDYGTRQNYKHYGSKTPPIYDLSKVNAEMHLFWSPTDWLADELDIEQYLIPTLPKEYVKSITKLTDFNHIDFLWGYRAPGEVFFPILEILEKDLKEKTEA